MIYWTFKILVVLHVIVGVVGLVSFWGPVATRKGSPRHRKWGFVFANAMMIAGTIAVGISMCSLIAPLETHPDFTDAALARGLFGWMMLYLALLTISLGFAALAMIRHKADHRRHREPVGIGLQVLVMIAAVVCAAEGYVLGMPLMMAIASIGLASGATTLGFIFNPSPGRSDYLLEHVKSGIGAGISAYTAFLSVGLVRLFPEHAFNPAVWAMPVILGIGLIVYHQHRVRTGLRSTPANAR